MFLHLKKNKEKSHELSSKEFPACCNRLKWQSRFACVSTRFPSDEALKGVSIEPAKTMTKIIAQRDAITFLSFS